MQRKEGVVSVQSRRDGRNWRKRTQDSLNLAARSAVVAHRDNEGRLDTLYCSTASSSAYIFRYVSTLTSKSSGKRRTGSDNGVRASATSEDNVRMLLC
jgi:hypothetical protein